jgi:glycosyltransferase involved in cell wall biosynthesis
MSVLESYALGKPVIGARIGGITEIVIDKKTGYLFPSGDVNKLAVILERVNSQSNQSIKDMGYNARKFAEANFTKNRYFDEMSALYNSIISD